MISCCQCNTCTNLSELLLSDSRTLSAFLWRRVGQFNLPFCTPAFCRMHIRWEIDSCHWYRQAAHRL